MPVVYLHIPKTAGTSLRSYLSDQFPREAIVPYGDWQGLRAYDRIPSAGLIAGHFDVRLLELLPRAPRRVITFLREPVARTLSALHHALHDPAFRHKELDLTGRKLADLLLDPDAMRFFANTQTAFLSSVDLNYSTRITPSGLTELSFDTLVPDIACAIRNLEKMDFIGLTENFASDLLILADILGTYPPSVAPKLNIQNPMATFPSNLTQRQLRLVCQYNESDLELYEYARRINSRYRRRDRVSILSDFILRQPLKPSDRLVSRRPFPGCGFYEEECDETARPFRWSGPADESCLTFRIPPSRAQVITLELWFPGHPFCDGVRFSSDSRIRTVWSRKQGRRRTYLIHLDERERGWIELSIISDQIAYAGGDLRQLGFVLMDADCFLGLRGNLRKMKFGVRLALDRVKLLCRASKDGMTITHEAKRERQSVSPEPREATGKTRAVKSKRSERSDRM